MAPVCLGPSHQDEEEFSVSWFDWADTKDIFCQDGEIAAPGWDMPVNRSRPGYAPSVLCFN